MRFLSHAETLRLFQRACVRAGINLQYSQGFNPHPRLSLPLPRPVGVVSDDELLTLRVHKSTEAQGQKGISDVDSLCASIRANLSEQLPEGCELISVSITEPKTSFQPFSATYVFAVRQEYIDRKLKERIQNLPACESLVVERPADKLRSKYKKVDVRGFLNSIELDGADIIAECGISPAGSIRVQEVLELLELDETKLASPVRRTNVRWTDVWGERTKYDILGNENVKRDVN